MTGGKPPEPPDRATPAADDLAKTRYGDPRAPPSAAGAPPLGGAAAADAVPEPKQNAVRAVRAIGVRDAGPASPRSAPDEQPPQRDSTRPTWRPGRSTPRPPALPARRSTAAAPPQPSAAEPGAGAEAPQSRAAAAAASQPSAAEPGAGAQAPQPRAAAAAPPQPSAAEPGARPDAAQPRAAASAERAPTDAPVWPAASRTSVFLAPEQLPIGLLEQTRSAGSYDPVATRDDGASPNRQTPPPERTRGAGADHELETTVSHSLRSSRIPRLRMSGADGIASSPSLGRRVYPDGMLSLVTGRKRRRWPMLSLLALSLSVLALSVAIVTLAPRGPSQGSSAAASHDAAMPALTDRHAATSPAALGGGSAALPIAPHQAESTPHAPAPPAAEGGSLRRLTASEPPPRMLRRETPSRRSAVRGEFLPPPVPPSTPKKTLSAADASVVAELEREARDHLADGDYAAAKRIYERLRLVLPSRHEYAAMLDLLTARLAKCGQAGADPCPLP